MESDEITLISLTKSQLHTVIKNAVSEVLSESNERARQKELLNAEEICKWLGISLSTLNVWKRDSKIPFKRLGKRIFFSKVDVLGALKESDYSRFRELGA